MNISKTEKKYIYRGICTAILAVIVTAMFFNVWYRFVRVHNQTGNLMGYGNLFMSAGIYLLLFLFIGRGLKAFRIGVDRKANLLASMALSLFSLNALEILVSCAITGQFRFFPDFLWRYALLFAIQVVITCVLVNFMVDIYRHVYPPYQILEVYQSADDRKLHFMNDRPDKYHIADVVCIDGGIEAVYDRLDDYDAVLINDIPAKVKNDILKECFKRDKRVYFTPKISDIIVKNSEDINLFDTPLYLCRNSGISEAQLIIKRVCDCIISALGLIITSPVFAVVAIAIRHEDHGPVFYRQKRMTIGGREFEMLKFRSMIVDAEKDGRPRPAGEDDDRITKVGHRIRPVRIDELPQLFNIFLGDMSIVGPRPLVDKTFAPYPDEVKSRIYSVKPGLTGIGSVVFRDEETLLSESALPPDECYAKVIAPYKGALEMWYLGHVGFLTDWKLIFLTAWVILFPKSRLTERMFKDLPPRHDGCI